MGRIDKPTDTRIWSHIFIGDKAHYGEVEPDILQQNVDNVENPANGCSTNCASLKRIAISVRDSR
ncbi:hypothetical protein SPHFLASMR4Y_02001 [Sphingorhabdus sp. SMR4y]|nr:hypothetical protein SPHFLASMR4Y_02001 [Sphingorhabdus sp. SMR4y]